MVVFFVNSKVFVSLFGSLGENSFNNYHVVCKNRINGVVPEVKHKGSGVKFMP